MAGAPGVEPFWESFRVALASAHSALRADIFASAVCRCARCADSARAAGTPLPRRQRPLLPLPPADFHWTRPPPRPATSSVEPTRACAPPPRTQAQWYSAAALALQAAGPGGAARLRALLWRDVEVDLEESVNGLLDGCAADAPTELALASAAFAAFRVGASFAAVVLSLLDSERDGTAAGTAAAAIAASSAAVVGPCRLVGGVYDGCIALFASVVFAPRRASLQASFFAAADAFRAASAERGLAAVAVARRLLSGDGGAEASARQVRLAADLVVTCSRVLAAAQQRAAATGGSVNRNGAGGAAAATAAATAGNDVDALGAAYETARTRALAEHASRLVDTAFAASSAADGGDVARDAALDAAVFAVNAALEGECALCSETLPPSCLAGFRLAAAEAIAPAVSCLARERVGPLLARALEGANSNATPSDDGSAGGSSSLLTSTPPPQGDSEKALRVLLRLALASSDAMARRLLQTLARRGRAPTGPPLLSEAPLVSCTDSFQRCVGAALCRTALPNAEVLADAAVAETAPDVVGADGTAPGSAGVSGGGGDAQSARAVARRVAAVVARAEALQRGAFEGRRSVFDAIAAAVGVFLNGGAPSRPLTPLPGSPVAASPPTTPTPPRPSPAAISSPATPHTPQPLRFSAASPAVSPASVLPAAPVLRCGENPATPPFGALLARALDSALRDTVSSDDDTALAEEAAAVASVVRWLADKDAFAEQCRVLLSRRLLAGPPVASATTTAAAATATTGDRSGAAARGPHAHTPASLDAERVVLEALTPVVSAAAVRRMHSMLLDFAASRALQTAFAETAARRAEASVAGAASGSGSGGVAFECVVLTDAHWPRYRPEPLLRLPTPLQSCLDAYAAFFRSSGGKRKLRWLHTLATVTLAVAFPKGRKEITATLHQAALLLYSDEWGPEPADALARRLGPDAMRFARRVVASLCNHRQFAVLAAVPLATGGRTADATSPAGASMAVPAPSAAVGLNLAFQHKTRKFRLPLPTAAAPAATTAGVAAASSGDGGAAPLVDAAAPNVSGAAALDAHRNALIDACVVRVLKARRQAPFADVCASVVAELSVRHFEPTARQLKLRVEDLAAREFLQRDAADPTLLTYTA